jgi:hypothetical protein
LFMNLACIHKEHLNVAKATKTQKKIPEVITASSRL